MRIELSPNVFTIFDDSDWDKLSWFNWGLYRRVKSTGGGPYAQATVGLYFRFMHIILMEPEDGFYVDHINGNGLDNRRSNLRIVTNAQNQRNIHKPVRGASRFKNVTWSRKCNRWQARISIDGKRIQLGHFKSEVVAARSVEKFIKENGDEHSRLG